MMNKRTGQREPKSPLDTILRINTTAVTRLLSILAILQFLINLAGQYAVYTIGLEETSQFIKLFDMDRELSIPSIFSTFLLFSISILLATITILKKQEKAAHITGWGILSFGFLVMTFDEGASFHEILMQPISRLLMYRDIPSIFYFTWVIPAIIGVLLLALVYLKFIIDLPKETRWFFLLSGTVYLGGAIGVEMVSGYFAGQFGTENLGFNIIATLEEIMEIGGLILFIHTLLKYLGEHYPNLQFFLHTADKPD